VKSGVKPIIIKRIFIMSAMGNLIYDIQEAVNEAMFAGEKEYEYVPKIAKRFNVPVDWVREAIKSVNEVYDDLY
jgi:hypothetical protein